MNEAELSAALDTWQLEREIVLMRVINAPRQVVFSAWTNPADFGHWFGPDGFTTEVHAIDPRVGGLARFNMLASDGTVFTNRYRYIEIVENEKLVMDHGSDVGNDPDRFRVTVTFDQQDDVKTIITMRQLHSTTERRSGVIAFGAVEMGLQTLAKLARHVGDI